MTTTINRLRLAPLALLVAMTIAGTVGCARNRAAIANPPQADASPPRTRSTPTNVPMTSASSTGRKQSSTVLTVTTQPRELGSSASPDGPRIYTPKQLGPGVVLKPNLEKAPVVPRDTTISQYVTAYYNALLEKRWSRAMSMVPAQNPRDKVKEFKHRMRGYETASFHIVTAGETNGIGAALVAVTTPHNGVWNTTWEFGTTNRGLVVKTLKYGRVGQNGCH